MRPRRDLHAEMGLGHPVPLAGKPTAQLLDQQPVELAQRLSRKAPALQSSDQLADNLARNPGVRHNVRHHAHGIGRVEGQALPGVAGHLRDDPLLTRIH
jgi:hypothetical protein